MIILASAIKESGIAVDPDSPWYLVEAVVRANNILDIAGIPEDRRPPESCWHNSRRVKEWLDNVDRQKSNSSSNRGDLVDVSGVDSKKAEEARRKMMFG